jgi:nucleoside-diphosphate-sugar epimerase
MVGCGDLGSRIAQALLGSGAQVHTLTRRDPAVAGTLALLGDVGDVATLPRLPDALDLVVYCLTPAARDEAGYQRAYVDGLRNVMACVPAANPVRVCFVSSTAVYGAAQGDWVDESSACDPPAFNGRLLLQAEALALRSANGLVLRLGGIYGPGRESLLRSVIAQAPLSNSALDWGNRIHVDDAAAAACHLILGGFSGIFNIVDDSPAPTAEVMAYLALRMRLPVLTSAQSGSRAGGRRVRNAKLHSAGFGLRYPDFRAGYDAVLAERDA